MKKTFEHLLGLSARDALALLRGSGIFDVRVTFTQPPVRPENRAQAPCPADGEDAPAHSALQAVAGNFQVSEDGEPPFDPLLEPMVEEGVLSEARVIGVRDDGRQLLVARFRVSPKEKDENE